MFATGRAAHPITGQAAISYNNYVSLLLNGDGTNGVQNNTFLDSSASPITITRNAGVSQGSFSPYGSLWSNSFVAASSQSLTITTNANINISTSQDFTIEAYVYANSYPYSSSGYNIWMAMNSTNYFSLTSGGIKWCGNTTEQSFACSPAIGTWNHVAVSRSSGSLRCFLNGVQVGSTIADSQAVLSQQANLFIAANQNASQYFWDGYVSNVRVVKGTALYTAAFTPSTTPLTAITGTVLLTCQSNRFIDNSSNAYAITIGGSPKIQRFSPFNQTSYNTATNGGSGFWDAVSSTQLTLGTDVTLSGDFTVEGWFYQTGSYTTGSYSLPMYGNNNTQFAFDNGSTGAVGLYNGTFTNSGSGVLIRNVWNHIAWTRQGSIVIIYVNGVNVIQNNSAAGTTKITEFGNYSNGSGYEYNGFISNLRATNVCVYTGNFTPPTAPITNAGSTSAASYPSTTNVNTTFTSSSTLLLMNFTNAGIVDSAMSNDLQTVGTAQVSTSVKKYGTGSLYFPSSSDKLQPQYQPTNNCFALGAGDFTIEGWLYMPTVTDANYGNIISSGASSAQFILSCGANGIGGTNGKLNFMAGGDGTISSSSYVHNSTWHHFAIVRNGLTYKMFVDGTLESTMSATAINYVQGAVAYCGIGGGYHNAQPGSYLDDIRITKGVARYTASFVPPAAPLSI